MIRSSPRFGGSQWHSEFLGTSPFSVAILVASVFISAAAAVASCNPYRWNDGVTYFDGWATPSEPSIVTVNTSNIFNYPNPYVYSGSGVFAWVMLNGPSSYAQVGWVVDYNGRHTFTEWTGPYGSGFNFSISPQTPGITSWYEVYMGSGTKYCFAVNGANVGCTIDLGWWPHYAQDLAEIHTLADQMPGGSSVQEIWSNAFIYYSGAQHNFNGNVSDLYNNYFHNQLVSQTQDKIYDLACSS